MQVAVIEYARNVLGLAKANSTEFDKNTADPVIGLITEWKDASGMVEQRNENSDLGGTMRLGAQVCHLVEGSLAHKVYGAGQIRERHRHRYEVNNAYVPRLEKAGLIISAHTPTESLPEMMELPTTMHPWFFGVQFHPEFTSTPRAGHPLFLAFIKAALERHNAVTPIAA